MGKDVKMVAKFLYCSSVLEEKVAHAYERLAERAENSLVKSLLLYISTDSLKHSIILRAASEEFVKNVGLKIENCEEILGEVWGRLALLAEEMPAKGKIEDKDLASLADKMANFESFVGEEYLTTLHLKATSLMANMKKVDLGDLKDILEWIAEDEERHQKIIFMIKDMVSK